MSKLDLSPTISKRTIQICLAILWLLDGALQLQRQMFTSSFANKVLNPASLGQPAVVSGPIHFEVHLVLMHPAIFDAFFAIVQLGLGLLILFKRTARFGLFASVAWALGVWFLGEGFGGLLTGNVSLWMGAPGAALIYAVLALAVLPNRNGKNVNTEKPAYWLPIVWAIVWVGGVFLQIEPNQNSTASISSMVSGMSAGAPGWLAQLDISSGRFIHEQGYWFILLVVVIELLAGLLVFVPGYARKLAIMLGIALATVFWVLGENFGTFYTGVATDPNTGPLLILLGLAVLGCVSLDFKKLWRRTWHDAESLMT